MRKRFIVAVGFAICLAVTWPASKFQSVAATEAQTTPDEQGTQIPGTAVQPIAVAVVDFAWLGRQERARGPLMGPEASVASGFIMERGRYEEPEVEAAPLTMIPEASDFIPSPSIPSPSPAKGFLGLDDIPAGGISFIPPDTMGAVGPTRVFTTLNNNYRVQDRDGVTINTVPISTFWAATGAVGPFDPKTVYDPYNNRFIVSAVSNAQSVNSSILLGVSNTSDPNGTWTLWRYAACDATYPCGATTTAWFADYPELGFNVNWVAVSVNMFTNATNAFTESRVLAINYATLRSGAGPPGTFFTGLTNDFTIVPAVTYSPSEPTLYAPNHFSSAGRSYRLNTITGTPDDPIYTQGPLKTHSLVSPWVQPAGDILPQAPEPGTGTVRAIDTGDARILNCVFRNNAIWYAQTVGLPAGGPLSHIAAQWVKLNTSGDALDAGRVDDPTATSTNGGKWYAYPSIAVNMNNDVMLGFSQFSSAQFPSAGYTMRLGTDPPATMRDPAIAKAGIGFYFKTFSGARNRWGDYSAAQVDPLDDRSLWTLQEYSLAQVGTGNGSGRWSTWWSQVFIAGPPVPPAPLRAPGDFDGDNKSEITVFRPSTGTWYLLSSVANYTTFTTKAWGLSTDIPLAGDYDGDGRADITVWRPSTGAWYILKSSTNFTAFSLYTFGVSGDIPVPGDYDGDSKTDLALFRPSSGQWFIVTSSNAYTSTLIYSFGMAGDTPAPADYDGDHVVDIALFRPSTGAWFILKSTTGFAAAMTGSWGTSGDVPAPGDYDGDGKAELTVWRPSTGVWYILKSSTNFTTFSTHMWGASGDVAEPGDYDNDGRFDLAVFRASTREHFVLKSTTNFTTFSIYLWGTTGDITVLRRP